MKSLLKKIVVLSVIFQFTNCTEEELTTRPYPRLKSFEVTQINEEGAVFKAEVLTKGTAEISSYGFVWGRSYHPSIQGCDGMLEFSNLQGNTFEAHIKTTLREGQNYNMRPFIKSGDYIVYGSNTRFTSKGSQGPELDDFYPKTGSVGDTILIEGGYFGNNKGMIEVYFGEQRATIHDFSGTHLKATVPNELDIEKSDVSVSVFGNTSAFSEKFSLKKHEISSISPTLVTFGTTLKIEGSNFSTKSGIVTVEFIGKYPRTYFGEVTKVEENLIEVKIPQDMGYTEFDVIVHMNNKAVNAGKVTMKTPVVHEILPKNIKTFAPITIKGENFSSSPDNYRISVGDYSAKILEASSTEIVIEMYNKRNAVYTNRIVDAEIIIGFHDAITIENLKITDKWWKLERAPYYGDDPVGISNKKHGYVIDDDHTYKFDPETRTWSDAGGFYYGRINDPSMFYADDKLFLTFGYIYGRDSKNLYEYNTETDYWNHTHTESQFPGDSRLRAFSLTYNSIGYAGGGSSLNAEECCNGFNDFWKYNTQTDTWTQLTDIPIETGEGLWDLAATELNGKFYIGLGKNVNTYGDIHIYDVASDTWESKISLPDPNNTDYSKAFAFTLNDKVYFGIGSETDNFWSFDGTTWNLEEPFPQGLNEGFVFEFDGVVYVGGGTWNGNHSNQFYVYDSTQPDN